jgi:hypothetical protein
LLLRRQGGPGWYGKYGQQAAAFGNFSDHGHDDITPDICTKYIVHGYALRLETFKFWQ